MGKPKKGGYPPPQPIVHAITIKNGEFDNAAVVVAWGDSVFWINKDLDSYTLVLITDGQPDPTKVWAQLGPVDTPEANSAEVVFVPPSEMPKDPVVYQYGMLPPGTAKATITAQIKV